MTTTTLFKRPWRALPALATTCAVLVSSALATGRSGYAGRVDEIDGAQARPKDDTFDVKAACAEVLGAHNRIRTEAKLATLAENAKLRAAAQRHAQDMAAQGKMTHTGSDQSEPADRIKAAGYRYRRMGENVAVGRFSIDRLMKGWMDSPPHKHNILGSFSQIGVACATAADGKRYWCVTFGFPARR